MDNITYILLGILIAIPLIFLGRYFTFWYFGIDQIIQLLEEISAKLPAPPSNNFQEEEQEKQ